MTISEAVRKSIADSKPITELPDGFTFIPNATAPDGFALASNGSRFDPTTQVILIKRKEPRYEHSSNHHIYHLRYHNRAGSNATAKA